MLLGHYKNIPLFDKQKLSFDDFKNLKPSTIEERLLSEVTTSQKIDVDLSQFMMYFENLQIPIGISATNTHRGKYFIAEKWEYPYWKHNEIIYSPSENNPIGEYLIILAEQESLEKITTSIHSWPLPPYAENEFFKGNNSDGCLRLRRDDMEFFFKDVELGAEIYIHE